MRTEDSFVPAGTAPCDPIVASRRYVLSRTNDGNLVVYQVQQQQLRSSRPLAVVDLGDKSSTLVGLDAAPIGMSLAIPVDRPQARFAPTSSLC